MVSFKRLRSVPRSSAAGVFLCLLIGIPLSAIGQYPAPATTPPTIPPAAPPPALDGLAPDRATVLGHRGAMEEEADDGSTALPLTDRPVAAVVEMHVTGSTTGAIWGTTIYTSDSDVATAAVHAGVLKDGESGRVKVTVLPGRDSYEATMRHGVASRDYGPWGKSFWIESLPHQNEADSPANPDTATSMTGFRGQHGHVVNLRVTGRTTGSLWGTEVYTDDSDVATAAVHAGILQPGQTGAVRVTVLPGRSGYRGSHHHGVTSSPYGAWHGSFWVDQPWYHPGDQHSRLNAP